MSFFGVLSLSRTMRAVLALAAVLALSISLVPQADARGGRGMSFGSRGGKTFFAPPRTGTTPGQAQPVQRSMTKPASPAAAATSPAGSAAATKSRFAGGFGPMLMGGLIGAGLFGLLSGHGLFGGMTGLVSMLGLLLQIGLIVGAVWLVMSFLRNRQQPAMAGMQGAARSAQAGAEPNPGAARSALGSLGGGLGGLGRGAAPAASNLQIAPADYEAFERLLAELQDAYSREDLAGLRAITTPEMVSYLSEDVADNAKNGVRNEISGTRLLQGDLAEAWREADAEYATVAMRFELFDTMVDRTTGRLISGNPNVATEATEIWTFKRPVGGSSDDWLLSAIQQTA
ncbi:MAG: Tim44 domain-containing protein [Hyphomicrobiaceae bacterium]